MTNDREVESQTEQPGIVLTDAPAPVKYGKSEPCPKCKAPATKREASSGFGRTYHELCGMCGFDFGERSRV